jgi:hypothetical protein
MTVDHNPPCELILKIGCNESDEISTAITSLLRSCSIIDQKCFFVERQIQPTTYFNSFTTHSSISKLPVQCQSLSCILFLPENILKQQEKQDSFKSIHIWNFHHKIELVDEYKQIIARQDYYELSRLLPLWSISNTPSNQQIIIRFNIFTKNFDFMLKFYKHLFQRPPDSSKTGFVLFNLPSKSINKKYLYQFSIKYSPSIQSYSISQGAYLKFRLNNLNHFIHEYTSKLFTINKYEYYIYDPDGNLLHLYLHNLSTNTKESIASIHTNDSGFGDSSDPSIKLFTSNISKIYPINNDIEEQSHSSNDSGQYSSLSSNERSVHHNSTIAVNSISVRSAKKSEIDYRFKQQRKLSLYDSEPRLSNIISYENRYYSSMNNVQKLNKVHSNFRSPVSKNPDSSLGYLNAFLLKKQQQQQSIQLQNVKQLNNPIERPKSAKQVIQRSVLNQSSRLRSKSVTFGWENTDNAQIKTPSSRIDIGITLDSRLRRTPVLDMLRSTTMHSDIIEPQQFNRTNSLRHSFVPIARF